MLATGGEVCSHSITIADYLLPNGILPTIDSLYPDCLIDASKITDTAETILVVCSLYACRISELLRLTLNDILPCDRVLITASKGSRSYIIYLPGIVEWYGTNILSDPTYHIFNISYGGLYAQATAAGLRSYVEQRDNAAIFHAARYRLARELSQRLELGQISDVMRHRFRSSTRHYMPTRPGASARGA